jgi:hypothetical protein
MEFSLHTVFDNPTNIFKTKVSFSQIGRPRFVRNCGMARLEERLTKKHQYQRIPESIELELKRE